MATLDDIQAAVNQHGSYRAAARALGISDSTVRKHLKKLAQIVAAPVVLPHTGFQVKKHTASFDAEGNLLSESIQTTAAPGDAYTVPAGYQVKGESVLVDASGRVTQKWTKTRENAASLTSLVNSLQEAFERYAGKGFIPEAPQVVSDTLLTVYPVPDMHMGLYTWGPECGDDYDTEIATNIAIQAVSSLVARSSPTRDAVVLINGDYFHQNDQKNVTPRSGHRLDVDGRWDKVYFAGCELLLVLVSLLLTKHEHVELVIIPGNHDEDAALTLRVAMSLYYRGHNRVRVYSQPGLFWYRRFGATLLGAMHGHTMKDPKDMALTMAADCPEDWGQVQFRQIFTGHIHHERAREVGPVRWESFQTPAPTDAFARGAGYRSGRSLTAITFHIEDGEVGRHRQPILPKGVRL